MGVVEGKEQEARAPGYRLTTSILELLTVDWRHWCWILVGDVRYQLK